MCMEISQYKGIARKFMDGLIRYIRIESDITGSIRKPVAVSLPRPLISGSVE